MLRLTGVIFKHEWDIFENLKIWKSVKKLKSYDDFKICFDQKCLETNYIPEPIMVATLYIPPGKKLAPRVLQ